MADNNFKNQSDYSLKKMTAEIYEALFFGKRRNYRKAERLFNALCKADTEKKYLTPEIEEKFRNEIKFQKNRTKKFRRAAVTKISAFTLIFMVAVYSIFCAKLPQFISQSLNIFSLHQPPHPMHNTLKGKTNELKAFFKTKKLRILLPSYIPGSFEVSHLTPSSYSTDTIKLSFSSDSKNRFNFCIYKYNPEQNLLSACYSFFEKPKSVSHLIINNREHYITEENNTYMAITADEKYFYSLEVYYDGLTYEEMIKILESLEYYCD